MATCPCGLAQARPGKSTLCLLLRPLATPGLPEATLPVAGGCGCRGADLWPLDRPAQALAGGPSWASPRTCPVTRRRTASWLCRQGLWWPGVGCTPLLCSGFSQGHGGLPPTACGLLVGRGPGAGLVAHVCHVPAVDRSAAWAMECFEGGAGPGSQRRAGDGGAGAAVPGVPGGGPPCGISHSVVVFPFPRPPFQLVTNSP